MIPKDELAPSLKVNFAPMVDFLFLTVTVFAVLAVSRSALFDTEVHLAEQKESARTTHTHSIGVSVTKEGAYKLLTEKGAYPIESLKLLQKELQLQHLTGKIDKQGTHILLHIDKDAQWESVANMIFSMKEIGFTTYPVYKE